MSDDQTRRARSRAANQRQPVTSWKRVARELKGTFGTPDLWVQYAGLLPASEPDPSERWGRVPGTDFDYMGPGDLLESGAEASVNSDPVDDVSSGGERGPEPRFCR